MKKILLAVTLALLASCSPKNATDNYRETLKQLILSDSTNTTMQKMQMKMFILYLQENDQHQLSTDEALKFEKCLEKYLDTQYIDDMVDIMLPCYRENVSEQQLAQISDLMSRPDIKQAYTHSVSLNNQLLTDVGIILKKVFESIKYGHSPDMPIAVQCTKDYRHKFDIYWKSTRVEQTVYSIVNNVFENSDNDADTEDAKNIVKSVLDITKVMMLNTFSYNITEPELDCLIELMTSDGYRAQLNALECFTRNPTKIQDDIKKAFVNWYMDNSDSIE